ncbi:hypothetical protein N7527_007173 [Penicillium freii]|nr:hypothetical protein N7527_007173 [Penicillium freii]
MDQQSTGTVKLVEGRWKPNGKKVMALHCYANVNNLVPSYRQVCVFPARLEIFDDLARMDINWMVRLLEQAMILLLDIYTPCKDLKLRATIGYTQEMYLEALEQCKIPLSVFPPQPCNTTKAKQYTDFWSTLPQSLEGRMHGISTRTHEEKPLYYCLVCYAYQSRHPFDRPAAFFNGIRSRPTAGPCDHCAATESVVWCWHWKDKDRVVYLSCRSDWLKHKVDRSMKR